MGKAGALATLKVTALPLAIGVAVVVLILMIAYYISAKAEKLE